MSKKKSRPPSRRVRRARHASWTQMSAARVAMGASRRTSRAERPARAPSVISARWRARVGRREKNCSLCTSILVRGKSHRNFPTRRFAGSAATRISAPYGRGTLLSYRRASHSSRMPGGSLAHPRGGFGVPREASGELGVLTGRERAQNAESAGNAVER